MKSSLSHTAAYIAVKFYGLTLNPKLGQHFDPDLLEYYDKVISFLPAPIRWYRKSLKNSFLRACFVASEEFLLPGDLMHIVSRKYYIRKWVSEAMEQGFDQLVVLGAGMDHLGMDLAKNGIHAFEIDTPGMMTHKEQFIEKEGYSSDYLHFCPLDVRGPSIYTTLDAHPAFNPSRKTLVVAEGFFDYLSLSHAKDVLDQLNRLLPDHRLITTFFSLDELNFFHRLSFTSGVAMVGEALKLPLNHSGWMELMKEQYYRLQREIAHQEMKKDLIEASGFHHSVLKGFYLMEFDSKPDIGSIGRDGSND